MEILAADHPDAIARAMAAPDAGELVIVPGDLAYLLVADALDDDAVERLFLAAERGADRPLTILLGGYEDLHHVAYGSSVARGIAEERWPGPVTLVLKARPWIPDAVTASQTDVRVSVPAREVTRALARQFGPLAGCAAPARASAALRVDAGALPGGEAKIIPALGPARE
jgi:L-threonylcarbamoyladenylate synthase